jgi:hypothetical protein
MKAVIIEFFLFLRIVFMTNTATNRDFLFRVASAEITLPALARLAKRKLVLWHEGKKSHSMFELLSTRPAYENYQEMSPQQRKMMDELNYLMSSEARREANLAAKATVTVIVILGSLLHILGYFLVEMIEEQMGVNLWFMHVIVAAIIFAGLLFMNSQAKEIIRTEGPEAR